MRILRQNSRESRIEIIFQEFKWKTVLKFNIAIYKLYIVFFTHP